jgi:hypothetical protein
MKKPYLSALLLGAFVSCSAAYGEPGAERELSAQARLQYQTIQLILQDLEKATDTSARRDALEEILAQSELLIKDVPGDPMVWAWRAEAALELDRWREGHQCGMSLLALNVLEQSDNKQMMNLMARLNRRGWLDPDVSKVQFAELTRNIELKNDDELPDPIKEALAGVITDYASGNFWEGYSKIKGIQLQVGSEEILRYPLARRALSASLAVAAARDDLDLVRSALACGGNPNEKMNAQPAIMWAANHNNVGMVEILIAAGARVNVKNRYGYSILLDPVQKDNLKMLTVLLEAGADPNGEGRKESLVAEAIQEGKNEVAAALVRSDARVVGVRTTDERPLLYVAMLGGDVNLVKALLDAGVDPEEKYHGRDLDSHAKKLASKEIYALMRAAAKSR